MPIEKKLSREAYLKLKRFERVNTGDFNQYSFKDKLTGKVYNFDSQEEAEAKMEELRTADI
jgi:hypothetical protein